MSTFAGDSIANVISSLNNSIILNTMYTEQKVSV